MSYELEAFVINAIKAAPAVTNQLGQTPAGSGHFSIWPLHARTTVADIQFPSVSVSRLGSMPQENRFAESDFVVTMDAPRLCIDVYDKKNIETCWRVYRQIDLILRGPDKTQPANTYFGAYSIKRYLIRDDLFDDAMTAYRIHAEYGGWLQLTGIVQP